MNKKCLYYAVIGNRDYIKIKGEKTPFWHFLDRQPDGFLSSLAYLPIPYAMPNLPMIGDCGAWSYKNELTPKLKGKLVTPEWALSEYKKHFKQGDIVIAPDHMLIPFEGINLNDRRTFNLTSATGFFPLALEAGYTPMATIHGMNLLERLNSLKKLASIGYTHFAIGGLAARASQKKMLLRTIEVIVQECHKLVPNSWVHALGLSSPEYFRSFGQIGVTSCDGSSHFKQAFTAGVFLVEEEGVLKKYKAARKGEKMTAPFCECSACSAIRKEGLDTRRYGSNETNMGRAAHNLNMLIRSHSFQASRTIALVSCVSAKASTDVPLSAKDLYRSPWFTKCRAFTEQAGLEWRILSAKYGLIDPNTPITTYEKTLNNMSTLERKEWASTVFSQICKEKEGQSTHFLLFAGKKYREYLIPLLQKEGYTYSIPLEGKGIGEQLAWFNAQIKQLN